MYERRFKWTYEKSIRKWSNCSAFCLVLVAQTYILPTFLPASPLNFTQLQLCRLAYHIKKSLQGQLVRSIVSYNKHHQQLHRSKQTMVKESARLRALARNASPPRRVLRSSSQPPSKAIQKKGIAKRVSLLTPVCSKSHWPPKKIQKKATKAGKTKVAKKATSTGGGTKLGKQVSRLLPILSSTSIKQIVTRSPY
jgi:hypothetical protein